jgi:hypothetical protein
MSNNFAVLEEYVNTYKNLPAQKSAEWLKNRTETVGASEIKSIFPTRTGDNYGLKSLVAAKSGIGTNTFKGNISTRLGNLFEDVARTFAHHATQCKLPIQELGSLPGPLPGQSYSPDGLGIVDIKNNDDKAEFIVLYEFKCPPKTEPNGEVPPQYMDQLQSGLSTVEISSYMIFVNSSFRKCALTDLNMTPKYDTNFHNTDTRFKRKLNKTFALGLIGFYIDKEQTTESAEILAEINSLEYLDYGTAPEEPYNRLLELVEYGAVKVHYSEIVYNDANVDTIEYVAEHNLGIKSKQIDPNSLLNTFNEFCNNRYKQVGILPWKLMRADILLVEPNFKWETRARIYLKKFWDIVNAIKSAPNPLKAYYDRFPDPNASIPSMGHMMETDSDSD